MAAVITEDEYKQFVFYKNSWQERQIALNAARAELAQLRADVQAHEAIEITLRASESQLRATVEAQRKQLEKARSAISHALFFLESINGYANGSAATGLRAWLSANAPEVK